MVHMEPANHDAPLSTHLVWECMYIVFVAHFHLLPYTHVEVDPHPGDH